MPRSVAISCSMIARPSRSCKESGTVVEVGKAAMCNHLDQLVNNRTEPWHSGRSGRAKLALSYLCQSSGKVGHSEAEAGGGGDVARHCERKRSNPWLGIA